MKKFQKIRKQQNTGIISENTKREFSVRVVCRMMAECPADSHQAHSPRMFNAGFVFKKTVEEKTNCLFAVTGGGALRSPVPRGGGENGKRRLGQTRKYYLLHSVRKTGGGVGGRRRVITTRNSQ